MVSQFTKMPVKKILIKYLHCEFAQKVSGWIWRSICRKNVDMTDLNVVFSISYLINIWRIWQISVWQHLLTTGIQKPFWCRPQKHGPGWIGITIHIVHVQGALKMVVFGGDGLTRNTIILEKFRTWYFVSTRWLKFDPSHKIVWSSTGSRGGDPYCTVRILRQSRVFIKILESESGNPDPDPFALLLVQFADLYHIWIQNYVLFALRWIFDWSGSEDPDPGSRLTRQL